MGIPGHPTCLLRNLYAGQEAILRTGHGTIDYFQIEKGVRQGCILLPCLFSLYAEYIIWNARLDEEQTGIKISRRNINNLRYTDDTTLMAESEEELKSLLMKVKRREWKSWLKLSIQKTKIMAFGPITSWQIDGETMETATDFILGSSKINANGDFSHGIKIYLLLWRKVMTNLNSISKSRDITDKVHLVKAMVFPGAMCGCENWTNKKGWTLKNWCFWAMVLEKTLESPLGCKDTQPVNPKRNQSWIFIGRTEAEAEAPILWRSDVKSWLVRKAPDTGKDWRQLEKGKTEGKMVGWHYWLNGHDFEQVLRDGEGQGSLAYCTPRVHKKSDMTEWLNNNRIIKSYKICNTCVHIFLFLIKNLSIINISTKT